MPAVTTALHRAFGLAPTGVDQPELAVAEGSVRTAGAVPAEPEPAWPPLEFTAPPAGRRRHRLVAGGAALATLIVLVGAGIAYANRGPSKPAHEALTATESPSPSAAPTPEPGKDPCLVGAWQQILAHHRRRVVPAASGTGGRSASAPSPSSTSAPAVR